MKLKESQILKFAIKSNNIKLLDISEKIGITQQGLHYHFRKDPLDYSFKRKIFDAFPEIEQEFKSNVSKDNEYLFNDHPQPKETVDKTPDQKDRIIELLEDQVAMLKEQVEYLKANQQSQGGITFGKQRKIV